MNTVAKPKTRSTIRKIIGKEVFILKRSLQWKLHSSQFAKNRSSTSLDHSVFRHKSFLLRKLRNVEMHLQFNKITNLRLATERINGIVIKPGESFSIWYLVGRPSALRGYKEGLVLDGGKITSGVGGGLCQLGNLLYWIALHSPLTIAERWRHSFDVFPDINRTIPFGCGATLSYNYIDLILRNDTDQSFQINLWLDDEYLNGELRSDAEPENEYSVIEAEHAFQAQWWGAYTRHNKIERIVRNRVSNEERTEFVTENDALMMYEPLLQSGSLETNV